ncbi:hypothetical protein ACFE04_022290 [Oxalis oulophora]
MVTTGSDASSSTMHYVSNISMVVPSVMSLSIVTSFSSASSDAYLMVIPYALSVGMVAPFSISSNVVLASSSSLLPPPASLSISLPSSIESPLPTEYVWLVFNRTVTGLFEC